MSNKKYTDEIIRVRYGETDKMGHAYYASYLYWFEQARNSWFRARGCTYKSIEERGFMFPAVEVYVRYRHEILYDEEIIVRVWVSEIKRASIKFEYEIYNKETGGLCTIGHSWHVLMGTHRKSVSIPHDLREILESNP